MTIQGAKQSSLKESHNGIMYKYVPCHPDLDHVLPKTLTLMLLQTRSPMIFNLFSKLTAYFQNGEVDPLNITENMNSLPSSLESHQQVPGPEQAPPAAHPEGNNAQAAALPKPRVSIKGTVQLQGRHPNHLFPGEIVRPGRSGAPNDVLFVARKRPLEHENETIRRLKAGEQIEEFEEPLCEEPLSPESRERLEQTYGRLVKLQTQYMSPDELQNSEWHDDEAWLEHIKVMHNLLYKMIQNSANRDAWLEGIELNHLLKIATYGMEQDVAVLEPFTNFCHPEKGLMRNEFWEFDDTCYKLYSSMPPFYQLGDDEPQVILQIEKVKAEIKGKRWLVAPVNWQTETFAYHWSMTIFDRLKGQLYIFDSLENKHNNTARVNATATGWARFWDKMGLPYDFQFFVPVVTPQCEIWECGYLSAVWALLTLRLPSNAAEKTPGRLLSINLSPREWYQHIDLSPSMLIADWTGWEPNTQNTQDALKEAYNFLFAIICNELGIPERYVQADGVTQLLSCQHTDRSWVPRNEHVSCDAGVHQEGIELLLNTYKVKDRRINAVPDASQRILLGPEVQRLICSARASHQPCREAEGQTTAASSLNTQQLDEQELGSGDKNANDDEDEDGENPTTGRISKPKTKPKAQSKSRAKTASSKKPDAPPAPAAARTRSGRKVKAPDRFEPEPEPELVAPKPKAAPKASGAKPARKNAAAKPEPSRGGAKRTATKQAKSTSTKSKKRTLDETEPKAGKNTSSELPKSKKRKVAEPPATSKPAKKQKKAARAKR
ncbi:unnamed protein product [Clonostachys chloroleuca]|uniref:Ubiquitin-like protease family profile domain-containing protein n=1 Tax=Clonostachys chloroleuca TaxID=1926264 RepID=A0AA35PW54_9HYPO|nr:unnamed protein product [Clonostachys chloroleuca]